MILRPRQSQFVERSLSALDIHGNTLGVAPTGCGKSVMLSAVTGQTIRDSRAKACVLAHRDELTSQNRDKFTRVNPGMTTSVVDANSKNWCGQVTFAMAPTLSRSANLEAMPSLDLLVIDEAHHAVADSYRRIIDRVLHLNPMARIYGVTATPNRGDRKGLREIFTNVADQIRLGELIASGHLVRPRTFVIDVGVRDELGKVRKTAADFDMGAVDAIMNKAPVTGQVIAHWREKAGERQTVVFCSTVNHAENVAAAFNANGIPAAVVHGDLDDATRRATLAAYDAGDFQVVVNVAVLTEGWDHPPTSCVILLRPSSFKSTMIQMVGRGLRTVNPEEYPGVIKTDCVILDFGTSTLLHGTLEQDVDLDGKLSCGDAPTKECPDCSATVPAAVSECPLCGHVWEGSSRNPVDPLGHFIMTEIDILARSNFDWVETHANGSGVIASGFHAWAGVFWHNGRWYGLGGRPGQAGHVLALGERDICLAAADDWLNENETDESAHKSRGWLSLPATDKQLARLPGSFRHDYGLTRYAASALISYQTHAHQIGKMIRAADPQHLPLAA